MPVLNFFILVYRSGAYWYARSVYTGDVAESSTVDGAIGNLVDSIDFAISIAEREGFTAEDWHAAQVARTPEKNYVEMFLDLVAQQDLERKQREAPSGHYIRNFAVAQKKDAA